MSLFVLVSIFLVDQIFVAFFCFCFFFHVLCVFLKEFTILMSCQIQHHVTKDYGGSGFLFEILPSLFGYPENDRKKERKRERKLIYFSV